MGKLIAVVDDESDIVELVKLNLEKEGFAVSTHKVSASKKGRGRYHQIWCAKRPKS